MGSKTTTTETKLPEPTPEEREAAAKFNAILDAQMATDYDKVETRNFVFKRQAEINAIDQQIAQLQSQTGGDSTLRGGKFGGMYGGAAGGNNQAQIQALQGQKNQLMQEGGSEQVSVQYNLKPEAQARLQKNRQEADAINTSFFNNAQKLLKGDFSISPEQKSQIQQIIGDNFDPVMNILTAEYSNSEEAVKSAVDKMITAGQSDIYQNYLTQKQELNNQLRQQQYSLQNTAAQLGRSYSDTDFQRATAEVGQLAQEQLGQYQLAATQGLFNQGAAQTATAIANLRGQRANALGTVAGNKANAGLNLSMLAANPLLAFGAGGQFLQLNNALQQQGVQNLLATGGLQGSALGQQIGLRQAQPTTTVTKPYGVLDVLGALGSLGAAGAQAFATFGQG